MVGESQRQMPLSLNMVLFEVHFSCPDGSFRDVAEHRALMAREATTWFEVIHMLDLLDVCTDNQECLIQVEDRFLRPDMDEAYLFDGSVVRIWIGSYYDPINESGGSETDISWNEERLTMRSMDTECGPDPPSSRTTTSAFAPVSGGLQMMTYLLSFLLGGSNTCRWRTGKTLRIKGARRHRRWRGLRLRSCRRSQNC